MMDNSVSSDGFPGSFAGSVPVGTNSSPPATETVPRSSPRQRLLAALTGLLPRNLPASNLPSGGSTAPSPYRVSSRALRLTALLAVLAFGLLFLLPGGLMWAQDAGTIEYAENGTDAVATFAAVDPEADHITWSLSGDDEGDFTIEGGVLRFTSSPDYEDPADENTDNTYVVTVTASDGTTPDTEALAIEVTNVDEVGTVMLSTLQPQVEVALTATLTDSDMVSDDTATWMWFRGSNVIAGAVGNTYTPIAGDVGYVLKVKATYRDGEGTENDKNAEAASAHAVRAKPATNIPPAFPDQDLTETGLQTAQTRMVAENTPSGRNIGAAVVASDYGDVLTYSFDADADNTFGIDRATGQLKTQAPLDADGETSEYTVTVTAKDPFGAFVTSVVTITVTGVDEDPSITTTGAAFTISFAEGTADDAAVITDALATYTASDPEEGNVTWSTSGRDAEKFNISAGALTFAAAPDFESPGDANGDNVYEVTVVASDPAGNSDELNVRVKVTNEAEIGTIEFSSLSPKVGVALTAELDDPDGDVTGLMWQWSKDGSDIVDETSDTYTPVVGDIGGGETTLVATATYRDGSLAAGAAAITLPSSPTVFVVADTDNKAPVFPDLDAEMDGRQTDQKRTVVENTVSGMIIGDPVTATDSAMAVDGAVTPEILTYTLGGADAASFSIARGTGQLRTKADLDYETKRSYTVMVTATDPGGISVTAAVTIEVADVDEAPELSGEAPGKYAENGRTPVATFTASDPERVTITWSLNGDDADAFTIDGGVLRFTSSPDYEAAADVGTDNTYVVTVIASDGENMDTEDVAIEVTNVDEAGTVTLSTLQPQVGVELMATLTDSDMVSGVPTWMWFRGSSVIVNETTETYEPKGEDAGAFLKAKATYRDGEDTGNDKNAEGRSTRQVRGVPTGGNTIPAFPDQNPSTMDIETAQTRMVAENTPSGRNIGAAVVAADPGDVLTYSYSIDNTADNTFGIDRATGQLKTQAPLDTEETSAYTVTVTATDPFGAEVTSVVTITVTDVDEDPSITTTGAAFTISFAEGTADAVADITTPLATYTASDPEEGNVTWSTSGRDAEKFSISAGALTFAAAPDFESPGDANGDNVYEVTVVASDPAGNSDELNVRVKVTNEAEIGTIEFSSLSPKVGVALTAELDDPDGDVTGLMWQWSKGGADIVDETSDTYTPVVGDIPATLVATATYRDGSLAAGDPAIRLPSSDTGAVVADTDNKAPVFPDQDSEMGGRQTDQKLTVLENTVSRMTIGEPVTATDSAMDAGGAVTPEILTYTLGGADAASFSIARGTGQLRTKADLDYETKRSYTVMVTATDPGGISATAAVTIMVTDVDEAPEIMGGGLIISGMSRVDYAEDRRDDVATYRASGPDAASATWKLEGDDAGDFDISSSGVLTFRASPNYETPADADTDNAYEVTVVASDGTYSDTQDVAVTVTDVDEAPVITGDVASNYAENGTGPVDTYSATDPESATIIWSLEGDDAADFEISADGVITFKSSPDHEAAADDDTDNAYEVTVVASDGANEDRVDVTITVTDENEAPPVITGDAALDYAENGTDPVALYSATDPDSATIIWSLEGDDAALFEISADGVLTFKSSPDHEAAADADTDNAYEVTVVASDGTYSDTQDVAVTVTDVDEAPVITGDVASNYAENGTGPVDTYSATDPESATIIWSLEGDDAADFEISADGVITFKSSPDHEAAADDDTDNAYEVTVVASDGANEDRLDVTITVTDANEAPPVITGTAALDYAENGTDPVALYLATDPEGADIIWSLGGDDAAAFEISADAVLTFKSSPDHEAAADADTDNAYEVTVVASDGTYSDTQDVAVTVTDVDEAPVITGDVAPNYAENGTGPVDTYSATDPESATIIWSLEGDDAADFEISADGVLTFKSPPDYEAAADADPDNVYKVTVKASDGTTNEVTLDVTVTVTDVDDPADPLKDKYDANENGEIERAEVFAAINDYQDTGVPTRAGVFKLIELYLGD